MKNAASALSCPLAGSVGERLAAKASGPPRERCSRWLAWLPRLVGVVVVSFALSLAPSSRSLAGDKPFSECWQGLKDSSKIAKDIKDVADKYLDPKCDAFYENPGFWALAGAFAAAKAADALDCSNAPGQAIATFISNLPEDTPHKDELAAIAAQAAGKATEAIPFLDCACKASQAPDDARKLWEDSSKLLTTTGDCGKAIAGALLMVPGYAAKGIGWLTDAFGEVIGAVGDFLEGLCFWCDSGPSPEVLYANYLDAHRDEICHNANISDYEVNSLAQQSAVNDFNWLDLPAQQKAQQAFAEKCFQERCKAREEKKRLVCEGTGGQWWQGAGGCGKGGLLGQCLCPGKWHGTWCEPIPCPTPYTPIVK